MGRLSSDRIAWHRRVLALAIPIILTNLTQPMLSAVDTAVAGHFGDPAVLGGVALSGVLFGFLFWGFGFLRMGTTALVAQAHGAGDADAMRATLLRALLPALGIGIVILLVHRPLITLGLNLLGSSDETRSYALAYSGARIGSAPLVLGNYVIFGYLLGRQRVRLALLLQVWINLVNMGAVFLLVYHFDAGVAGIGGSTAIADTAGFLLGCILLLAMHREKPFARADLRVALSDTAAFRRLLLINRDIFVRTLCLLGSFGWFARMGAGQGDIVLAANALLLNFQTFMAYALDGFAHAAETLVGAATGGRDRTALRATIRTCMGWGLAGAALFSLAYLVAGEAIVALLTDQDALRKAAGAYLPWVVLMPLCSVAGFLFDGVFIGATRTRDLMQTMLLCFVCFFVLANVLTPLFGNGGLWLAFSIFMLLRGALLWLRLPSIYQRATLTEQPKV